MENVPTHFRKNIHKLLDQVHPQISISKSAVKLLTVLLQHTASNIDNVTKPENVFKDDTELRKCAHSKKIKFMQRHISGSKRLFDVFNEEDVLFLMRESSIVLDKIKDIIGIAAVLEYLAAEILELSGDAAKRSKTNETCMIKTKHINLTLENDEELNLLLN